MADEIQVPGVSNVLDEIEAFVPDGWKEGDDIFATNGKSDGDLLVDEQEAEELSKLFGQTDDSPEAAPTTGETEPESTTEAEEETPAETPDGAQTEPVKTSRQLTLKVNHKEETLDVNAMSDEDLIALLQKGRAFDAMKESENKQTYRRVYQEQVDAGMTEAAARMIAQNEVGGKTYALTDEEEAQAAAVPETPAATAPAAQTSGSRDFAAELGQLNTLLGLMGQPKMEKMPEEVAVAAAQGIPLPMAYMAYQQKQSAKTAASLQKENKVLKQNAASAARAPVKGVTGGDSSPEKAKSIYEKAFDAGLNW